ncbi:hypothetical protein [Candidatus Fukatsuia endosymbiont of Tuberolachnus salignus]|uniref:hypothetical protein n=1 Tax=Candidatus Fukatsuia endosymbiont of Tuberolachnus salignus TaxID=3077957 RepID=UPI00313D97A5
MRLSEPGQGNTLGRPLTPMVQRIKAWLSAGNEVRIFTARAETPDGVIAVQHWLLPQTCCDQC